ncbi:MAG: PTS sugar transporter subunit IIA [Verrucomicrobia bacterium]|nr:PTS sugar transporter subunit IIA [Verrucomicrobiota bacterium]
MKLAELLSPCQILLDLQAVERWAVIVELVECLVASGKLPGPLRDEVLEALRTREELVSTGIGSGVAIPHAFSGQISQVAAVFGRSKTGIDFEALDQTSVNFIILFIVPQENYPMHLHTLSAIAKMFTSSDVRRRLAAAETPSDILAIFQAKQPRSATAGP